jgi:hypothetical protein
MEFFLGVKMGGWGGVELLSHEKAIENDVVGHEYQVERSGIGFAGRSWRFGYFGRADRPFQQPLVQLSSENSLVSN